jgi:hypothetical protein
MKQIIEVDVDFEMDLCFCSCGLDGCDKNCPNYEKKWNEEPAITITFENGQKLLVEKYKWLL